MPRLRRLKDWDWEPNETDIPNHGPEPSDEADAGQGQPAGNQVVEPDAPCEAPKGWWSNEAIIQAMPDNKLHTAVGYHRTMVRLLEQEIVRRSLAPRKARGNDWSAVGTRSRIPSSPRADAQSGNNSRGQAKRTKRSRPQGQQVLTTEQMLKALEILCKNRETS